MLPLVKVYADNFAIRVILQLVTSEVCESVYYHHHYRCTHS